MTVARTLAGGSSVGDLPSWSSADGKDDEEGG